MILFFVFVWAVFSGHPVVAMAIALHALLKD